MIDFSKLEFGDKIFHIIEDLNLMSRKKIVMVDNDGVEWYRYDKPTWSYSIKEYTYVGKYAPTTSGKIMPDEVDAEKYFVEADGEMDYLTEECCANSDKWFASEEEAKTEMKRKQKVQKEIDRR